MSPKRIIIVGTMVFMITFSGGLWSDRTSAGSPTEEKNIAVSEDEDLYALLKGSTEEEVRAALYEGKSLAEVATEKQVDVERIILLQIREMTKQLDLRLARGSITPQEYRLQKEELREIITRSVHGIT